MNRRRQEAAELSSSSLGPARREAEAAWSGERASVFRSALKHAAERAIGFLVEQHLEERAAADGRKVGIQSTLATNPEGVAGIDLYDVLDGLVTDPSRAEVFDADPLRETWQLIADQIQRKLGFPLEPELFSNMTFVALLGDATHPELARLTKSLLSTFRHSDARGLYHFFTSLRFACDIDCTGVAARARLVSGDIDPATQRGAAELRRITDRILGSAAVCDVASPANSSDGKDNGSLHRHVFKVYLDDHEIQGAGFDRGLKNNPVVSLNALFPVLAEIALGLRKLDEQVALKEYASPDAEPRCGSVQVAPIVAANLAYVAGYLLSGDWRSGCRYYGAPEAFLYLYSELVSEFGMIDELFGVEEPLIDAILERREMKAEAGIANPDGSLNLALRALAARNLGLDPAPELEKLLRMQDANGGFTEYAPFYGFGSGHGPRVYFGSSAQTTAFAIRALSSEKRPRRYRARTTLATALRLATHNAASL